ncbi:hypothetical protein LIER_22782 [Lithospermum erythrorhizon]|uniref:Uncharacterized protein n=1 Tax=Lithospermum erythrorhizon TaxID=34254 RepID=A0AAV3QV78_LITER
MPIDSTIHQTFSNDKPKDITYDTQTISENDAPQTISNNDVSQTNPQPELLVYTSKKKNEITDSQHSQESNQVVDSSENNTSGNKDDLDFPIVVPKGNRTKHPIDRFVSILIFPLLFELLTLTSPGLLFQTMLKKP